MALNIKDAETHELARKLACLTGESLTKAVRHAIEERLARIKRTRGGPALADELDRIALHCAGLPRKDRRNPSRSSAMSRSACRNDCSRHALVAILGDEPERRSFNERIEAAAERLRRGAD